MQGRAGIFLRPSGRYLLDGSSVDDSRGGTCEQDHSGGFLSEKVNGTQEASKKPEMLELFEDELRAVVGGFPRNGSNTYSGSDGWADVANADDCSA